MATMLIVLSSLACTPSAQPTRQADAMLMPTAAPEPAPMSVPAIPRVRDGPLLLVGSALDGHDEGHEAPIAISDAGATAWAKPLLEASQPLIDEFPAISSSP